MGSLQLNGDTLGQKYQSYNKQLYQILQTEKPLENLTEINYDDSDINNLLKIDIACQLKQENYILEVFKSKDLLFVSRAIKRSTWLITDPKFTSIINPDYIIEKLFPYMTTKAYNKLLLHIRINLKDEKRVDEFYLYFEETDLKKSFKWLQNSSDSIIEKAIKNHGKSIPSYIMKRLVKKSNYIFKHIKNTLNENSYHDFEISKEILQCEHINYVDFLNLSRIYDIPQLSTNKTKKIMKKCPEKIINNITKYITKMDIKILAQYVSPENIKKIFIENYENPYMKPFFKYDNFKHFLKRLNETERIKIIKTVFIDKNEAQYSTENHLENNTMVRCLSNMNNEHVWYELMAFNVAFVNMKKLIEFESNPNKKSTMLKTLITCTHRNPKHILQVLEYYHAIHINEPYKYKSKFVNYLLKNLNFLHFEMSSWHFLNNIFFSMGIYKKSNDKKDEGYVDCIIIYNAIHGYRNPDVILKKFNFKTFKSYQPQINETENVILFKFLKDFIFNKLNELNLSEERDFNAIKLYLKNVCDLFCDWKKRLSNYPEVFDMVNKILMFLTKQCEEKELQNIYEIGKCLQLQVIENTVITYPTKYFYIYAIKYRPHILRCQIENIYLNTDKIPKKLQATSNVFRKLSTYWPNVALDFKNTYWTFINDKNVDNIQHLYQMIILLSNNETSELLQAYLQQDIKDCNSKLTIAMQESQKIYNGVIRYLYLSRQLPSIETMLPHANQKTFKYIAATIRYIIYNMNYCELHELILKLSDLPIPIQKITLRAASMKLRNDDLLSLLKSVWTTNKNRSIRLLIIRQIFSLLCSSQNATIDNIIWTEFSYFIENLSLNETKATYVTLCNMYKVPTNLRRPYYEKVVNILQQLSDNTYIKKLNDTTKNCQPNILHQNEEIDIVLQKRKADLQRLRLKRCTLYWLPEYLLNAETEKNQMERYEANFLPFLEHVLKTWNKESFTKSNFLNLINSLTADLGNFSNRKIIPLDMFTDIYQRIVKTLSYHENYFLLLSLKLTLYYLESLKKLTKIYSKDNITFAMIWKDFAKACVEQVAEDIPKYSPTIYLLCAQALDSFLNRLSVGYAEILNLSEEILLCDPQIECYFVVIQLLPRRVFDIEVYNFKRKIIKKITSHPSDAVKMYFYNNFIKT